MEERKRRFLKVHRCFIFLKDLTEGLKGFPNDKKKTFVYLVQVKYAIADEGVFCLAD
jgi:hypothetical protein